MSLSLINQSIQTVQQFPLIPQMQELRNIYQVNQQLSKPLGKSKLGQSFWNQDISQSEIEISKILHSVGYSYKPDPVHKFDFDTYVKSKVRMNLTIEDYRQLLLEFFENQLFDCELRRKYLLRHQITMTSVAQQDMAFYDPFTTNPHSTVGIEMIPVGLQINQVPNLQVSSEIHELESRIKGYQDVCDKLSNERVYDNQRYSEEQPQIQISADDDLIFDRINSKVYQSMPFITDRHLKEYYNYKQNKMVNECDDLDSLIYLETLSLRDLDEPVCEYQSNILIPVTMPALQEEVIEIAQHIDQDIGIDNGALFLFAIDKQFMQGIQEQNNKYLIFLPYNLDQQDNKTRNFQQQTMHLLNELKDESIRKNQYRIRSSAHWIDTLQVLPQNQNSDVNHILNQYEDTAVNSWMKFLLYVESDRIIDKLNKDISQVQEKVRHQYFPEIYFQFYLRYQKLLYLESRSSLVKIMHCLNVFRTAQKNLNIYYVDLHNLKNQMTKERILKKQHLNLGAFLTNLEQEELPTTASCPYLCEETIKVNKQGIFEVIDGNGYRILNEIIFKDLYAVQDKIAHLAAFTLQFTIKLAEINNNDSEAWNRQKVIKELLHYECQYLSAKCKVLLQVMPLLQHATSLEIGNAISVLSQMIASQPDYQFKQNVIDTYIRDTKILEYYALIFQHTKQIKLILRILQIKSIPTLEATYNYMKRNKMMDKPYPFKQLYKDPVLDKHNNLSLVIRELPLEGNYNILSILEYLTLRRKFYKFTLRIYYLSEIYMKQYRKRGNMRKLLDRLEQIPNRVVDQDNINMFEIMLDEYVKIGKECLQICDWQQMASDNYRLIDYLVPLKSLILLDYYMFNIIQINKHQDVQFIDAVLLKEKVSIAAIANARKQSVVPGNQESEQDRAKQTAVSLLSNQFKGAMLVKNFIHKISNNSATNLQEFNNLFKQHCVASGLTLQGFIQRKEMISLNKRLPFANPLFEPGELMNDIDYIKNPFALVSETEILTILNYKEVESKQKQVDKDQQMEEDWITTQKLKLEKNIHSISPNKKTTKFKSAGSPFSNICKLNEPITSSQQLTLQLVYLLIAIQSPNCNVHDLIYFKQGLLNVEELKRNQLRLRRDLEGLVKIIGSLKANVGIILESRNIQNINTAILTYLHKLIKRYHTLVLTTLLSSVHQFRSQLAEEPESYSNIINQIGVALGSLQYRGVNHIENVLGQAPKVLPSIQGSKLSSDTIFYLKYVFADKYFPVFQSNPSNLNRPLRQLKYDDYFTQQSPYLMPTKDIIIKTNRINYNVGSYFNSMVQLIPNTMYTLFTLFPQSKLIYYSTIQDLIITEADSILRNKCIFEVDDIFKYERAYRKIILIQLRYLVLSEYFVSQQCKTLPFKPHSQDPCTQWLEQCVELSQNHMHKQTLKAGLFMQFAGLTKSQVKGIQPKSTKQYMPQERFDILPRLRLDSFENQVFQLVSMMLAAQSIMFKEGITYYGEINQRIAAKDANYTVALQLNVFYSNFERDALRIKTLNKGEAHVIADSDLNQHLIDLNHRLQRDQQNNYPNHLITQNQAIQMNYDQKILELKFATKKLKFYESNINHIVESLVAQRTNDLIFENDSLKQLMDHQRRSFEIEKDRLRDEIRAEFQEQLHTQDVIYQDMMSRFNDYKKGISMELSSFIGEYKSDGLKRIKEKASEALFGQANKFNIDLDVEYKRGNLYDAFQGESEQIIQLFTTVKKMRTFYKVKEVCLREKYDKKIQLIMQANSSNEELQQKIQEIQEKVEVLKDELIQNRKVITIMDNQNQILRRDLQKFKIERFTAMREKGQLGAVAAYKEQEVEQLQQQQQSLKPQRPATSSSLRKVKTPNLQSIGSTGKFVNGRQKSLLQVKYKVATG